MRIVHVITRMILGGAQENTLLTVQGLQERGHDVLLVTGPALGPEGELLEESRRSGVRVEIVESLRREIHPVRDLKATIALRRLLRRERPQVVHTHSSKAGIIGRAVAAGLKIPVVIHTIHGLPFHPYQSALLRMFYIGLERRAARWTDRLITVADAMADQASRVGISTPDRYTTVYSGMEVDRFLAAGRCRNIPEEWNSLGIGPEHRLVTTVARLAPLKGHEDLLEMAPRIVRRYPEVRFLFVGSGELQANLEQRVAELGVGDHVIFAGLTPAARIPEVLGASDLVVHPSYREGLARVLPQAILAGVPVITYDLDGAGEIVEEEISGSLVSPGHREEMEAKILSYLARRDSSGKIERVDESVRLRVANRFRSEVMVEEIEKVYDQELKGRKT
ncbi:MAG: glycosyltransferase family 4 protein, partial [Planctomycetota bacterium]|nr:glycosyltransferase family 4 protein [Planctomycetota bacterium]